MGNINLKVQIEINGSFVPVGKLSGSTYQDAVFSYAEPYLSNPKACPISLNLPLEKKQFDANETRTFFEGLLPEGFTRQCIADSLHSSPEDYISILRELGSECLGAVQIIDDKNAQIKSGYEPLSVSEVKALAAEGVRKSAELVIKSHLSLTGASGKVGLYLNKEGKWYKPFGIFPSTHIVKQSHVRLENIVVNEQLCLLTAKKLGIDVPESFIVKVKDEDFSDEDILFATRRFDRAYDDESKIIDGFAIPYRLHQEDFAQTLGIKSSDKYEKNRECYLQKMFNVLSERSSNPIEDSLKLWRRAVFNFLIGNTDNHIKNNSLLYSKNLLSVRLAPCYDIICTRFYESSTDEMSLSINGKLKISQIIRNDFAAEAKKCGLGEQIAMKIFDEVKTQFRSAVEDSAAILVSQGFAEAKKIAEFICRNQE